jgi:hypothetical protein
MIELLRLILHIMASLFKPRTKLVAEILVLRQQLNVLRRQVIEATTTQQYRSLSVRLALSLVPFRPQRDCNSPARDNHPLASRGVHLCRLRFSVAGKRVFQGGEKSANTSPEPPISGLRDQAVIQEARQLAAFATTCRNSPQTVNCVVGSGGLEPPTRPL